FASTANNTHSVFMGIPNNYLRNVAGISLKGSQKIDGHYAMLPITPNIRQVDVFGGFTAAAGHHFYTARTYPKIYWNQVAFVCEPTGGLVHIAKIEKDGAGYVEKDGGNLIASADEWFSPVEAKVGPDGAVWVLDWYNFIIQHNPTPNVERGGYDAENGPGNAYINPLRDKSRGRIWRIMPRDVKSVKPLALDKDDTGGSIKALSHDNMFWRMTAQRLLVEKGNKDIFPELYKLIGNKEVDALGLNPGALHALWTLDGLGAIASDPKALEVVKGALSHPSGAVRRAALQILPRNGDNDGLLLKSKILNDKDPGVQLAALLYFSEREPSMKIGEQLFELSREEEINTDDWLGSALYVAGSKHHQGFTAAFMASNPNFEMTLSDKGPRQVDDLDDTHWKKMQLPQFIEDAGLDMDGIIWFRKNMDLPSASAGKSGIISLGPIDDSDKVYINGTLVGETKKDYKADRMYKIPAGILKAGENTITVWVQDTGGGGGIWGNREQLFLKVGTTNTPLAGEWKYDVEEDYTRSASRLFEETPVGELLARTFMGDVMQEDQEVKDEVGGPGEAVSISIKTIENEMKYDITEFVVEAGKLVELVFENTDFMQHNLVITQRGEKEKVGMAADKLAMATDGADKNYVPVMPEVLYATAIVDPEKKAVLRFVAPKDPGDYPYICTFPG
ncbi:MAG TPA: beta galactosidase jelly roll domain-containing protein, partial [Arenibacter sp.]|nr:beta galactosidase jelly roll domain-containing protein [Arenibacter sp.]